MSQAPYKIVPYEPGAADVIDRQTSEKIGYVLLWHRGWSAYLTSDPGVELIFGHAQWPEKWRTAMGHDTHPINVTKHRRDAAAKVWAAASTRAAA